MPSQNLLMEWVAKEPIGSLFALITAILLFGRILRSNQSETQRFSADIIRLLEATGKGLIFLCLLVVVYAFISLTYSSFSALYGSIGVNGSFANMAWLETKRDYPDWVTQRELQVNHFVEMTRLEQIPNPDPSKSALYQTIIYREEIPQNSIVSFTGHIDIILKDSAAYKLKGGGYNNFSIKTHFNYKVANQAETTTETEFLFPLQPTLDYENVSVQVDGKEMFSDVSINSNGIFWKQDMLAGQQIDIDVFYESKGMDNFVYKTPKREINDFILDVETNFASINVFASPLGENFTAVSNVSADGQSVVATFRIDNVYLEPTMGCGFVAQILPYDPHKSTVSALQFAPRATLMLGVLFALTILICTQSVYFRQLTILLLLLVGQNLTLMGVEPFVSDWRIVLFLTTFLIFVISLIALKRIPRLPRSLILIWTIFFSGFYPLASGFFSDPVSRNSFENILLVGIIIYIFALTFLMRLRVKSLSQT